MQHVGDKAIICRDGLEKAGQRGYTTATRSGWSGRACASGCEELLK